MRITAIFTLMALATYTRGSTTASPTYTTTASPTSTTTATPTSTITSARRLPDEVSPEDLQMLLRLLMLRGDNVFGFTSNTRRPPRDAPQWVVDYFDRIAQIATSPEHVITVPRIENQVRVIGQEIYRSHGHEGMVAVCEYNRQYKAYIERAWDGIGRWLA